MPTKHFVSASCRGEHCRCGDLATHKVGEEIAHDDPNPIRHNLTAYVCCAHFQQIMGPVFTLDCRSEGAMSAGSVQCDDPLTK